LEAQNTKLTFLLFRQLRLLFFASPCLLLVLLLSSKKVCLPTGTLFLYRFNKLLLPTLRNVEHPRSRSSTPPLEAILPSSSGLERRATAWSLEVHSFFTLCGRRAIASLVQAYNRKREEQERRKQRQENCLFLCAHSGYSPVSTQVNGPSSSYTSFLSPPPTISSFSAASRLPTAFSSSVSGTR
jgi:hypothetical protein